MPALESKWFDSTQLNVTGSYTIGGVGSSPTLTTNYDAGAMTVS